MKTETVKINSLGLGISEALAATEALGAESGLSKKENLHLRLLAEELLGMLRSIAGKVDADYQIKNEDKRFELHMKSKVEITDEMRRQFISASTSGKNAAAKGVMGKIRLLIADFFLSGPAASGAASGLAMSLMSAASSTGQSVGADTYLWSLKQYKEDVGNDGKSGEAWDELEKSIVANIADEINVKIVGPNVEIIIFKTF